MTGWQMHQLDHTQIICTSIKTDNHASISAVTQHKPKLVKMSQMCHSYLKKVCFKLTISLQFDCQ